MAVPTHISNHRRELCSQCLSPCENQKNADFHKLDSSVCPIGRFGAFTTSQPDRRPRGLGDVVEVIAKPIAKASDSLLKTKFVGCAACAKRRDKLNNLVPFK